MSLETDSHYIPDAVEEPISHRREEKLRADASPFGSEAEIAVSVLRSAIEALIVINSSGHINYCNPRKRYRQRP